MTKSNNPKSEAQKIYNSFGHGNGKDHIIRKLYDSGSSEFWRRVWNEYQKFIPLKTN